MAIFDDFGGYCIYEKNRNNESTVFVYIATPFGQCPILEVDGKQLVQSHAIARYLARQHGLAGQDDWEQAQADMYTDCINDLMNGINQQC